MLAGSVNDGIGNTPFHQGYPEPTAHGKAKTSPDKDLWGPDQQERVDSLPALVPDATYTAERGYATVGYLYADDAAVAAMADADYDFALDAETTTLIWSTGVPTDRRSQVQSVATVSYDSSGGTLASTVKTFDVTYKDAAVVDLGEGNGYLMILVRARKAEGDGGGSIHPENSLSDIVGYWSSEPTFRGEDTVGPRLLVDTLDALGPSGKSLIRFWLGAPGAVVATEPVSDLPCVYLYYVVDRSDWFGVGVDADDTSQYDQLVEEAGLPTGSKRVACRRFEVAALVDAMRNVGDVGEARWDEEVDHGVMPGVSLGYVRFWIASGDFPSVNRLFALEFRNLGATTAGYYSYALPGDPQPAVCDGKLSLYFCVLKPTTGYDTNTDYGVWRGAALPEGLALSAEGSGVFSPVVIFGRDFIVRDDADLVVASVSSGFEWAKMYEDPAPFQLPNGTWRLYAGAEDEPRASSEPSKQWALDRFTGEDSDGCDGWAAGWVNVDGGGRDLDVPDFTDDPGDVGGAIDPPRTTPEQIPIPPLERPGVPWDSDTTTWMLNGTVLL